MSRKYISEKQYHIILSFALMMLFTTSSVLLFLTSVAELLLFLLLALPVAKYVQKALLRRGLFMLAAALIGEAVYVLSDVLSFTIPQVSFWLLPGTTFLFLLAPLVKVQREGETLEASDILHGVLYYVINGFLIALLREAVSFDTFCGFKLGIFKDVQMPFFSHASGAALLVMLSLLLLRVLRNSDTGECFILTTRKGKEKKYRPISLREERRFLIMHIALLVYDIIFGGIGILIILQVPAAYRRTSHIVLFATLLAALILPLVARLFKQADMLEEHSYLPLVVVIRSSVPMILYMQRLSGSATLQLSSQIVWWLILVLAVWLCSSLTLIYIHAIPGRLLFGKQPDCLEGIPFVLLHCLLALIVFMPWMDVLSNL